MSSSLAFHGACWWPVSLLAPLGRGHMILSPQCPDWSSIWIPARVGPNYLLESSLPLPVCSLNPIHLACMERFSPFSLPILVVLFGVYIFSPLHDHDSKAFGEQVSPPLFLNFWWSQKVTQGFLFGPWERPLGITLRESHLISYLRRGLWLYLIPLLLQ